MTSEGGLVPAADAAERPAALLLSGPAGGVRAAAAVGSACGFPDAVSFDMGGTSTDVCLVRGGVPEPAQSRIVAGYPIRLPALDIHTIGAGGGSIARLDAGGALVVGPESAGAVPGPAGYGRGGEKPTVTDADLVLARISAEAAFPGLGRLDWRRHGARSTGTRHRDGVVAVVDAAMERAVRVVTVERGVDARNLALIAFGGAGPLHRAPWRALDMRAVIIPPRAGCCRPSGSCARPASESWSDPGPTRWTTRGSKPRSTAGRRGRRADRWRRRRGGSAGGLPTRDKPQLTVTGVDAFSAEHERRNGFARPGARSRSWRCAYGPPTRAVSPADLPPVERSKVAAPKWWPSRTARSRCPRMGGRARPRCGC